MKKKIYGDKVSTTAACSVYQTKADGNTVYQPAEYSYKQGVVGDGNRRKNIRKYTGKEHHIKRIYCEFLSDVLKADIRRNQVKGQVKHRIGYLQTKELSPNLLQQYGQAAEAAGKETSHPDETPQIEGDYSRCKGEEEYHPQLTIYFFLHFISYLRIRFRDFADINPF